MLWYDTEGVLSRYSLWGTTRSPGALCVPGTHWQIGVKDVRWAWLAAPRFVLCSFNSKTEQRLGPKNL